MPAGERRSVGEVLVDSDFLVRDLLAEVSGEHAAAMLRSWPQFLGAAERLWMALPSGSLIQPAEPEPMGRLIGIGAGIGRSATNGRWPGPGSADQRMVEISGNLRRAATLVERYGQDVQPISAAARGDIGAAQARIVHTLYVVAHATAVATDSWVGQTDSAARRPRTRDTKLRQGQLAAAPVAVDRLKILEQIAGRYVAAHPVAVAALRQVRPAPKNSRLGTALSWWAAQVHRTLAGRPDTPDLVRIARVQALMAASTRVIAAAGAIKGPLDLEAVERTAPLLRQAELAWTRLAQQSGRLVGADGTTGRALSRSAAQARAAITTTRCTPLGWADPQQIAERTHLVKTSQAFQQSMLAAVDVAHLVSDIARSRPYLTAPAHLLQRTQSLDPFGANQGENHLEDARRPDKHQLAVNRRVPVPPAERQGITTSAAATSMQAATTAALIGNRHLVAQPGRKHPRLRPIDPPTSLHSFHRGGPER